jgi:hypothetical protein
MSKKAFDKIAAGLKDAIAIMRGEADPSTYKVHYPMSDDKPLAEKPDVIEMRGTVGWAKPEQVILRVVADWVNDMIDEPPVSISQLILTERIIAELERAGFIIVQAQRVDT